MVLDATVLEFLKLQLQLTFGRHTFLAVSCPWGLKIRRQSGGDCPQPPACGPEALETN